MMVSDVTYKQFAQRMTRAGSLAEEGWMDLGGLSNHTQQIIENRSEIG